MTTQTLKQYLHNFKMRYTYWTDYVEDEPVVYTIFLNKFNELVIDRELRDSGFVYDRVVVDSCNLERALFDTLLELQKIDYKFELLEGK